MMNPSTYNKIAVASTFSPRFEQVLSEAGRIRQRFGGDLSLIYIGQRNDDTGKKFQDILGRLKLPTDSAVHYGQGDPADGILRAIADHNVDLIVAGFIHFWEMWRAGFCAKRSARSFFSLIPSSSRKR
jgi:hypothetical protein